MPILFFLWGWSNPDLSDISPSITWLWGKFRFKWMMKIPFLFSRIGLWCFWPRRCTGWSVGQGCWGTSSEFYRYDTRFCITMLCPFGYLVQGPSWRWRDGNWEARGVVSSWGRKWRAIVNFQVCEVIIMLLLFKLFYTKSIIFTPKGF